MGVVIGFLPMLHAKMIDLPVNTIESHRVLTVGKTTDNGWRNEQSVTQSR